MTLSRLGALRAFVPLLLAVWLPPLVSAQPPHVADLRTCPTASGTPVIDCQLAYRTHGTLSPARDNAVLIPMWYGGDSAMMTDLLAPLGIDTTRYFVVVVDPLGVGASSAPSNSRRQPGARFPALTIGDMVDAQHRLVTDVLGIDRLHAVVGYSMGAIQAVEWAARYPEAVARAAPLLGAPWLDAYGEAAFRTLRALTDLAGAGDVAPETAARALATYWHVIGATPEAEGALPADSLDARLDAEVAEWLAFDLDDNRVQLEAMLAYDVRDAFSGSLERTAQAIQADILVVTSPGDHLTPPGPALAFADAVGAETLALEASCGHGAFGCELGRIGARLRLFLATPVTGS